MRHYLFIFLLLLPLVSQAIEQPANTYQVLCYHDVRDDVHKDLDRDPFAVSTDTLVSHFAWFKEAGYNIISLDDVLAAQRGERPLPPKALMLNFDDGYKSFYTRIYPLLKLYNYPAVMALVTKWLDAPEGGMVQYGDNLVPRENFISWDEAREMQASGLVEFATHTDNMHRGILANPQGNNQPAVFTRYFNAKQARYESKREYMSRIRKDLATSKVIIDKELSTQTRAVVWPYGKYNKSSVDVSAQLGMPITLTLDDDEVNTVESVRAIGRILIIDHPKVGDMKYLLEGQLPEKQETETFRAVRIDLNDVYDADEKVMGKNIDRLLDRIKDLSISHVFLSAFNDEDGDGQPEATFFNNSVLPPKADIFNRIAWSLKIRVFVEVYADITIDQTRVQTPTVKLLNDLSTYANFDGVVFNQHDNGRLAGKYLAMMRKNRPQLKSLSYTSRIGSDDALNKLNKPYNALIIDETAVDVRALKSIPIAQRKQLDHYIVAMTGSPKNAQKLRDMQALGFKNIVLDPENLLRKEVDLAAIRKGMSLAAYPFKQR